MTSVSLYLHSVGVLEQGSLFSTISERPIQRFFRHGRPPAGKPCPVVGTSLPNALRIKARPRSRLSIRVLEQAAVTRTSSVGLPQRSLTARTRVSTES